MGFPTVRSEPAMSRQSEPPAPGNWRATAGRRNERDTKPDSRKPAPGVADDYADLLQWLDDTARMGLISQLAVGFYENWHPDRGEIADLVAMKLGILSGEEQLQRARQRKERHLLVEFTAQDFAEHR